VLECPLVASQQSTNIPGPSNSNDGNIDGFFSGPFQECKKEGQKCSLKNAKKLCCEEFACVDKTCVKKDVGPYKLGNFFVMRVDMTDKYKGAPLSMSDDGTTLVFKSDKSTHVRYDPFSEALQLPTYNTKVEAEYKENSYKPSFDPVWTNAVSGDGKAFAVADYENQVVRTYRLSDDEGYYPFGKELRYGAAIFGTSFGSSIALSKYGNFLVIGADQSYEEGNDRKGFIMRYEFVHTVDKEMGWGYWKRKGDVIFGDNPGDELGRLPLEISSDGSRIAVGGGANGFVTVYDWDRKEESWSKVERLSFECKGWAGCVCDLTCIQNEDGIWNDPMFGKESLVLSSNGNILAIGDSTYDPERIATTGDDGADNGAIYFYKYKDGKFVEYAEKLVGPPNANYGRRFDMSDDGKIVVVSEKDPYLTRVLKLNKKKKKFESLQEFPGQYMYNVEMSRDGKKIALLSWKENIGTRLSLLSSM